MLPVVGGENNTAFKLVTYQRSTTSIPITWSDESDIVDWSRVVVIAIESEFESVGGFAPSVTSQVAIVRRISKGQHYENCLHDRHDSCENLLATA